MRYVSHATRFRDAGPPNPGTAALTTCFVRQAVEGTRFLPPSGTLVSVLVGYSGQPQATK